jgi:hypothetical protein
MSCAFERLDCRSSKLGVRGRNPTTGEQFGGLVGGLRGSVGNEGFRGSTDPND